MVRLTRAAEEAKIALSTESYVQVIEENLYQKDGVGLHLDEEISRPQYEDLVESLLERTRRSIQVALKEAKLLLRDLDEILLVGGVTRTPKVGNLLRQELQKMPRQDIDPDTAIVMGAALQASRIMGESGRILVDVSPFSFGTSCIGEINDVLSQYRYEILIRRNTPLPARQTQIFYTMYHGQTACEVKAYQGEEIDARNNIFLGKFLIEGLDPKAPSGSEILCDFRLDLSGILQIEVTEKHTGLRKQLTIEDAFRKMSQEEIEASRNKIREMFNHEDSLFKYIKSDIESDEFDDFEQSNQILPKKAADGQHGASILKRFAPPIIDIKSLDPEQRGSWMKTISLLEKVERMYADINPSDQTEIDELANNILHVMYEQDFEQIHSLSNELADVLFYLE
jgi:molecular chaperone DnaK (HSP70)